MLVDIALDLVQKLIAFHHLAGDVHAIAHKRDAAAAPRGRSKSHDDEDGSEGAATGPMPPQVCHAACMLVTACMDSWPCHLHPALQGHGGPSSLDQTSGQAVSSCIYSGHCTAAVCCRLPQPDLGVQAQAVELLCRCDDIPDDNVELAVLKGLLTAVTSSTLHVHGQVSSQCSTTSHTRRTAMQPWRTIQS